MYLVFPWELSHLIQCGLPSLKRCGLEPSVAIHGGTSEQPRVYDSEVRA